MRNTNRLHRLLTMVVLILSIIPGSLVMADDPATDIEWPASGETIVAQIQARFNTARAAESALLPLLTLPTQAEWDALSDAQKALWLINRERIDRGVPELHGLESNVMGVAQAYADYLMANNAFGHDADGLGPKARLNLNPTINACHDFLGVSENLAIFWHSGSGWTLPIERSIYNWMYDDSGHGWGHRHAILWPAYTENSGPGDREGFLGIGHAFGPHSGWQSTDIVVMNVFDPCATWDYGPTALPGDLNGDGQVNATDVNLTLEILSGSNATAVDTGGDVDGNGRADGREALFGLQKMRQLRTED